MSKKNWWNSSLIRAASFPLYAASLKAPAPAAAAAQREMAADLAALRAYVTADGKAGGAKQARFETRAKGSGAKENWGGAI